LRCAPRELADHEPIENLRERAEGVRVAYVAATRARDLLVVPAIGDEMFDGWLGPLNKAMYPSRADWRRSVQSVEGCPTFGNKTIVERPLDYDREEEFSVRPGLVHPERGQHSVVWWDPSVLQLGVRGEFGTRHEMLTKDDGGLDIYRAWQQDRAAVLTAASGPEREVFLASQSDAEPSERSTVDFASTNVARAGRPSGRRFGTLVHAVMSSIALNADAASIARSVSLQARILGASDDEISAANEAVGVALAHPLLTRARAAERCHREYPVVLPLADGKLLEGIVDLAFVENGGWIVVDFKTDADLSSRRESYETQLRWYAFALAKLSGVPATGYLLAV
jgi:ATP-dependent exoDNAse (exonuclease V) beta subunit